MYFRSAGIPWQIGDIYSIQLSQRGAAREGAPRQSGVHPRQIIFVGFRLRLMIGKVAKRVARMVLTVSVSLWMAGAGCLWGCSNMTASAQSKVLSVDQTTVVASSSCHARTQDCCSKGAQQKSVPNSQDTALLGSMPQGMMKDCPLAVSASAVSTSKSTESAPELTLSPAVQFRGKDLPTNFVFVPSVPTRFQNRGPTYLRCCVFLI